MWSQGRQGSGRVRPGLPGTGAWTRFRPRSCIGLKNTSRGSPGGIGSRISTTMVPGRRMNWRRGQKRPEFRATGRQGTPRFGIQVRHAELVRGRSPGRSAGALGKDQDLASLPDRLLGPGAHLDQGRDPALRSIGTMSALRTYQPTHPEFLIAGDEDDLRREPKNYVALETAVDRRIFAHGRDPYFFGWNDTLAAQLPPRGPARGMIDELRAVAKRCDGVRCDMAMLVEPEVFARTWGERACPGRLAAGRRAVLARGHRGAFAGGTRTSSSSPRSTGTSNGRCKKRDSTSPTTSGSTTGCAREGAPCASISGPLRFPGSIAPLSGEPRRAPRRRHLPADTTAPPPSRHSGFPACGSFMTGNSKDAGRTNSY